MDSAVTLRSEVDAASQNVEWTVSMDADMPARESCGMEGLSADVSLDPRTAAVTKKSVEGIYPYIEGFTVLDRSALNDDALSCVQSFFSFLRDRKGFESVVSPETLPQVMVFMYDFDAFVDSQRIESCLIGGAFGDDDSVGCAMRIIMEDKTYMDLNIYLSREGGKWKIQQAAFR